MSEDVRGLEHQLRAFVEWLTGEGYILAEESPVGTGHGMETSRDLVAAFLARGIRTEVTVLGPDDPGREPLGFRMTERNGVDVYKLDDDFRCGTGRNTIGPSELQAGMEVAIPAMTGGYNVMTIGVGADGKPVAMGGGWSGVLRLADDGRAWWVCIAMVKGR
jgi:hypothetical protein